MASLQELLPDATPVLQALIACVHEAIASLNALSAAMQALAGHVDAASGQPSS